MECPRFAAEPELGKACVRLTRIADRQLGPIPDLQLLGFAYGIAALFFEASGMTTKAPYLAGGSPMRSGVCLVPVMRRW